MKRIFKITVFVLSIILVSGICFADPPEDELRMALLKGKRCLEDGKYDDAVKHLSEALRISNMNSSYVIGVNATLLKEVHMAAVDAGLRVMKTNIKDKANKAIRQ